jgi:TolB protein
VSKANLRTLAHHISDLIYQVITGKKGDASSRIAYIEVKDQFDSKKATYQLFIADADGFNPRLLLMQKGTPISSPKWSFDNQELAYVTYVNNRMAIYSIELKTGTRRLIANYPGINSSPSWSPDGRKMVMALSMGDSDKTDLYIMDLITKKLDRLTQGETNTGAEWSPDGGRIAFTSNRGGAPQIYEMNIATRESKRMTFEGAKNYDAEYTPDGRSLVMMHQRDRDGAIRIARFDIATQKFTLITDGQIDKSPSISPGGNMVLYASYDRRLGILAETSMNGAVRLELPSQGGSVQSPSWSK